MPDARPAPSPPEKPLEGFTPAVREWFASAFDAPTPAQGEAWDAIRSGSNTLVVAPTGSGKTLAAFLLGLDGLFGEAPEERDPGTATRVLYVSPMKALGSDVKRNLRVPLAGIAKRRAERGEAEVLVRVGVRTGDTPSGDRARLLRHPPEVLITTPESLFLMLTSQAASTLRGVRTVIVDEVHAVAGTKRGSHLAVSLERLDALLPAPAQRVGLSATVRPVEEVAAFLGGARPVTVVSPASPRRLDVDVVVPVEDMTAPPAMSGEPGEAGSIWPYIEAGILDRVLERRSTIVFANSRGLAEKLTARLNELYAARTLIEPLEESVEPVIARDTWSGSTGSRTIPPPNHAPDSAPDQVAVVIARAHHGSVSKEQREIIETELKSGALRCVVATSSLELGIDMGLVDAVIQVGSPPSAASGLQRVGRANHQVGGLSHGTFYPRTRRDLVTSVVTASRMLTGDIEHLHAPANPLDVLAQHTVAAVALGPISIDDWYRIVRRSHPFRGLPRSLFEATLDMLAGRYPSEDFRELRPRIVWNRVTGELSGLPGAQRLAVTNGGTIPDRGAFTVILPEGEEQAGARRIGELDEEMVYESRVGDIIALGATTWRVQEITNDQVVVTPAPGRSARLPFWRGEAVGRPAELGTAIGEFHAHLERALHSDDPAGALALGAGVDEWATANLLGLASRQRDATGLLPTHRRLVVERVRDETGDWRVILHSPFGRRVHEPWALAVGDRLRRTWHTDAQIVTSDDGIVVRLPDTTGRVPGAELFDFAPDVLAEAVARAVGGSALFAARFRECAARALLLPRRMPGKRSPLWQQRLRAGQLLDVAREHPTFPILLEAVRECVQDVYDVDALTTLMADIRARRIDMVEVETAIPSPFAADLLFGYVAEFMYEGDAPLAERRASMLSLDTALLGDLLGRPDYARLLDATVIADVSQELQHLADTRRATSKDGVADLLRRLGPLTPDAITARTTADSDDVEVWLRELETEHRLIRVRVADEDRVAAIEDSARMRDGLGARLPDGIPDVFLAPSPTPLGDLVTRYAQTHTFFTVNALASHLGIGVATARQELDTLHHDGKILTGTFTTPSEDSASDETRGRVAAQEWVSEDVLTQLRTRSLRAARQDTKPAPAGAYARLLLEHHGILTDTPDTGRTGMLEGATGLLRVVEQLSGMPLPAAIWEQYVFPARIRDYTPALLDNLIATGDIVWSGHGRDRESATIAFHLVEDATSTLRTDTTAEPETTSDPDQSHAVQDTLLEILSGGGAYFAHQLTTAVVDRRGTTDGSTRSETVADALWALVLSGRVTSDTFAPVRGLNTGRTVRKRTVQPRATRGRMRGGVGRTTTVSDPSIAGRWSLLPAPAPDDTVRSLFFAEILLDRYAILTRSAAVVEDIPGGYPTLQRVLRTMEDTGRITRGRFITGLGAAQYANPDTIDRLRTLIDLPEHPHAVALSVLDPANPYGSLLPWPTHPSKTRPTRRTGGLVVIDRGRLALFLPPGGSTLLTYPDPAESSLAAVAVEAFTRTLIRAHHSTFTIETIDGTNALTHPAADALRRAGFSSVPKGLRWYG